MTVMERDPLKQERVPVLANDGSTPLGYCAVKKFRRKMGEPLKEITISDIAMNSVALIFVYKLHSRVHCGTLAEETVPIDSKHAVRIARAALAVKENPRQTLAAIQKAAWGLLVERMQE